MLSYRCCRCQKSFWSFLSISFMWFNFMSCSTLHALLHSASSRCQLQTLPSEDSTSSGSACRHANGKVMGLDHIKEYLPGRRSSGMVLAVSEFEVPDVSVVKFIRPSLLYGRIVLLTGASPSLSKVFVLSTGSLELCGLWVTAGPNPKHDSRLGGTKVDSVGSFVASSFFSTHVSKSLNSRPSFAPGRLDLTNLVLLCCQSGFHRWFWSTLIKFTQSQICFPKWQLLTVY